MKKIFALAFVATMLFSTTANAQEDKNIFNHVGVGYSLGTEGLIGLDVAAPICNYVEMRVGFSTMPSFKYKTEVDVESNKPTAPDQVKVTGKLHMTDFKMLFDIYPSKTTGFHFTLGAYIGKSKFITVENTEPGSLSGFGIGPGEGILIGDNIISVSPTGNASAHIKVNSFKPYLGIGFGRAVPKKRVGVNFDLGVQFWGSPGVYTHGYYDQSNQWTEKDQKVESSDFDGEDGGAIKIISKVSVWPVLSLRIGGRIL